MPSKPKNAQQARVDVGADTVSTKALTDRAQVVGKMALITPLYLNNVAFKMSVDDYVASGTVLSAAETKVDNLEAALTQARGDRDTARAACKGCHAVCVAQVEKNSPTAADLQAYGFLQLEIVKLGSVLPTGILWTYDHVKALLDLHVQFPGRVRQCVIEVSTDPIGPATWHRLDGHGARRSLTGYAPGTYWVRAATSLAEGRSEWFGPVAVVVK
jgi:hypothetical protein